MKKSKFLKKSLAMLLALMLVVAMIPLSASAATLPTLEYINVDTTQVKAENNSFSATYTEGATSVGVTATRPANTKLEAIHKDSVNSTEINGGSSLTLSNFDKDDNGVYTITLKLSSTLTTDTPDPVNYTLKLTPKTASTDASVKSIVLKDDAKDYGLMAVTYDASDRTVTVTAAYGYDTSNGKIVVTPVAGAKVGVGTAGAATEVTVTDKSVFTVTSEAGESYDWTIKVEEVPALTSLSVAGKAGEFSDADKDGKNDTITVTLTEDDIKNTYGDILENPDLVVEYSVLANTTVKDTSAPFSSGAKLQFAALGTNYTATKTINVKNGDNGTDVPYTLNVVIPKSDDTSVSFASIGGIEATVSGSSISAVLDKDAADTQDVVIHVAKNATVSGDISFDPVDASNSAYDKYTASSVDLSSKKTIIVTAADGKASKQYSVSMTKASTSGDATLVSFSAKDPNGNTYTASIDQTKKVITLNNLPYMTTGIEDWVMYATFSDGAKAVYNSNTVINGQTKFVNAKGWTNGDEQPLSDKVKVVSLGDSKVFTEYTVKVTFKSANTDKTLKSVEVTAQNSPASEQALVRAMEKSNTFDATIDSTNKKIKVETAFSQKDFGKYITEITTNGGVPYLYTNSGKTLVEIRIPDETVTNNALLRDLKDGTFQLLVLPEAIAKLYDETVKDANGAGADVSSVNGGNYATDFAKGTLYTFEFTNKEASPEGLLKSLKVGDTTLQVGSGSGKITGTIPYGMTIDTTELASLTDADLAHYTTFTISDYAALKANDGKSYTFVNGGDKDKDGEADATPADDNAKLIFVRDANNAVKVYVYGAAAEKTTNITKMQVFAEKDLTTTPANEYTFDLKYAEPNTGADVTSFKLGNTSASISGTTINVTMPFGTELKALIPTFTLSTGAKATVDGGKLESGKTVLNFTNDVKITVVSEDKKTSKVYTLKVTVADQFSDVNEGDWYYSNVMRAVELGILSGYSDGTFRPMNNITRRDFAIMLAQSLGHSNDEPATSPFKDVADDDYGVSSIAYLYEQGITAGDDKGNFNPDAYITRQEAAIFLARAFEATGTTSETFTDDAKIASWAKEYVYACKAAGLMNGDTNGTFRPTSTLTRAEAASAMVNAVDN